MPFYPPNNPKNQNFEKMNIIARHIILDMCTKNHNHMMYGSWDTEWDRHNFLPFWAIFCPFTLPLMILEIKILKKWKKCLEILTIYTYTCTINEDHMIYGSWNIRCNREFFVILGHFCTLIPWQPRKSKLWKIEKKKHRDIIIL